VSLSESPDLVPSPTPDLRRRARLVFASFLAVDLLFVLGLWGGKAGLSGALTDILLGAALLGGLLGIVIGMEPFRREEMRASALAADQGVVRWRDALCVLVVPLVAVVPLWHFVMPEPWRVSAARAVGILVYLALFMVLARLQRRGFAPYWRPAWYGFFLAGITAALVWSVAAGEPAREGIVAGGSAALLHYLYVRWATRGAARRAADAGDERRP
jgi:hypothetical protein